MTLQSDFTAESAAKVWGRVRTVPINTTGGTTTVIVHATTSGLFFVVFYLYIASSAGIDVTIASCLPGSPYTATALSGAIPFAAAAEKTWAASGIPVFKGRAAGDTFNVTPSGATNLRGFALVAEIQ